MRRGLLLAFFFAASPGCAILWAATGSGDDSGGTTSASGSGTSTSGTGSTATGTVCKPGADVVACQCADNLGGHQVCNAAGTGWGACACSSGTGGGSTSSSSASSSASSTSSSSSSSSSGSFCGGCPVPTNPCQQGVCVNSMCTTAPAPKGKLCATAMGGTVCDGAGTCVPWVPVVCRTGPTKTYTGCDGTSFSGYHIDWKINGMDWGCDGFPVQHGVCSPGTPCTVTVVPAMTLQGVCE